MLPSRTKHSLLSITLLLAFLTSCGGGGGADQKTIFNNATSESLSSATETSSSSSLSSERSSSSTASSKSSSSLKSSAKSSSSSSKTSVSSSSKSNSSGIFIDNSPPTAPGALQAIQSFSDVVVITWAASVDNVAVAQYRIYRDGELIETINASELEYHDFNVAANKSYIYAVAAGDAVDNWSTLSQVRTTTSNVSKNQPIFSSISSTSSSLSSLANSSSSSTANSSTSTSNSSLSTSSKSSSSSKQDHEAPAMPTGLKASNIYATQVDLSWTLNSEPDLAAYKIFRNGTALTTTGKTSSYSDKSASPNTSYTYQISAGDASGNWSTNSALLSVTTPPSTSGNTATLSWHTPTARTDGTPVTIADVLGYQIRYKSTTDTKYTYSNTLSNTTNSYAVTGLSGTYTFQIAAIDTSNIFSLFVTIAPQ